MQKQTTNEHAHQWRRIQFPAKSKVRNPDGTGLMVRCRLCGNVEIVTPKAIPFFMLLRAFGLEPELVPQRYTEMEPT